MIETVNAFGMILAGAVVASGFFTGRMINSPRWQALPVSIGCAGILLHGVHHLIEGDRLLGPISDALIWVGFIWFEVVEILAKRIEARRRKKLSK